MSAASSLSFPTGLYFAIDVDLTSPSNAAMLRVLTGQYMGIGSAVVCPKIPNRNNTAKNEEDGGADLLTVPQLLSQYGLSYTLSPVGEMTKGSPAFSPQLQRQNSQRTPTIESAASFGMTPSERRHDLHCTLWYCRDEIENAKSKVKKQTNYITAERKKQQDRNRFQFALNDTNAFPSLGGGTPSSAPPVRPPPSIDVSSSLEESSSPSTPFDAEVNLFWHKWRQYESLLMNTKESVGKESSVSPILLRLDGIYCGGATPEVAVCAAAVTILDSSILGMCHNKCPHLTITFGKRARAAQSNQLLEGVSAASGMLKVSPTVMAEWQQTFGNTARWVPVGDEVLIEGFYTLH